MTDNELLLAISDLMDKKLKPIDHKFEKIDKKFEELETKIDKKLEDMETRFDKKLEDMEARFDKKLEDMETRFDKKLHRLEVVFDERLRRIEILHENDVLPRLSTIEECYISTYERYKENVEHMEAMRTDIDLIKHVLLEHSEKLKKIS